MHLLLLLALGASAVEPARVLQQCRSNASSVSMFYSRLPEAARADFDRMYAAYAGMVEKRRSEGWTNGLLGNQKTNWQRSFREYGVMSLFKVADSPAAKAELERRITALEREFETAAPARRRAILEQLTDIRRQASLPRGVCEDWAKETAEVVRAAASGDFKVEWHEIRRGGHAVTFARHGSLCIALDPWVRGLPELLGCEEAEDLSPFQTPSCFAVYPPN